MEGRPPAITDDAPAAPSRTGGRLRVRTVLAGGLAGLLLAAGVEAGRVMLGSNRHAVIPGRVYRCSQPTGADVRKAVRDLGIHTVVNLRGCGAASPWYLDESRATHELNVAQEDICFSAGRLPSGAELRRFIEVLDHTAYPILLHCRRGADRTGMAAAIVLLLQTECGLDRACRQLGLRYGHVALGRPASLDRFFDLYRDWLGERGWDHSPARFRRWAGHEYCPGELHCRVEPLDFPDRLPRGRPFALRVRAHNSSLKPWRLRPESNAGVHVRYDLWDDDGVQVASARSGLFDAEVPPGRSIDLTLALPALKKPGRYRLLVDMVEESQCWFFQTGSEPLERELEVGE